MSSEYIALAINSPLVAEQIARITRGVAQKKVSLTRFRNEVRLPVPSLDLQRDTAAWFQSHAAATQRLVGEVETARLRSANLRRALLAAAFSGRLTGVRDVSEVVEEMAGV